MRGRVQAFADARCVCIPSRALSSPPSGSCSGAGSQSERQGWRNQSTAASLCSPEKRSLVSADASAARGQAGGRGQTLVPPAHWFHLRCALSAQLDPLTLLDLGSKFNITREAPVFLQVYVLKRTFSLRKNVARFLLFPSRNRLAWGWRVARSAGPGWLLTGPKAFWLTAHSETFCTWEPVCCQPY